MFGTGGQGCASPAAIAAVPRSATLSQAAWNEAEITRPSLGRWIEQFAAADQPIALRLLECMQMHG